MPDARNPSYPPHPDYDDCSHEWKEYESMSDDEVRCVKCGVHGAREQDGSVYWPAT